MTKTLSAVLMLFVAGSLFGSHVLVLTKNQSISEYSVPGYDVVRLHSSNNEPNLVLELDLIILPIELSVNELEKVDVHSTEIAVYSQNEKKFLIILVCENIDGEEIGDIRIEVSDYTLGRRQKNGSCGL